MASNAEEGRGTLRKVPGNCVQVLYPGMSEWGNPLRVDTSVFMPEHIGYERELSELKHLSSSRKREYSLSSGERKGKSPNRCASHAGVVGPAESDDSVEERSGKAGQRG